MEIYIGGIFDEGPWTTSWTTFSFSISGDLVEELSSALAEVHTRQISERGTANSDNLSLQVKAPELPDLKIQIYSKEHPPPHFHVDTSENSASFRITDCKMIDGYFPGKKYKVIRRWWKNNVQRLVNEWNRIRPTDCPVGEVALSEIKWR